MTRLLERNDTGPLRIAKSEIAGDAVYVCRCGLSRNAPFCDGSHKLTAQEPVAQLVRWVERAGQRVAEPVRLEAALAPAAVAPERGRTAPNRL